VTTVLALLAFVLAVGAAARSTWSPCGLSMLSTITPLAERGRGHRYGVTCGWFVLGATAGGLFLGAVTSFLAAAVRLAGPSPVVAGSVGLAASLVAFTSDTGLAGIRVPVHFRQVNERWLDAYRPWVYGVGFGFQIGCGLATYITTAAVYLMVVLAALTGDPMVALAVGGVFGLVRGLAVLATWRATTAPALLAFHRRFAAREPAARRAVLGCSAVAAGVLAVAVGPGPAVTVGAPVLVAAVLGRTICAVVRRRRTPVMPGPAAVATMPRPGSGRPADGPGGSVRVG
jgi:hypothetical protein